MKKSDIFWQTYLNLEKELIEVSKFVFITDVKTVNNNGAEVEENCNTQLETFSPHIADLLMTAMCKQLGGTLKERFDNTATHSVDIQQRINRVLKKVEYNNSRLLPCMAKGKTLEDLNGLFNRWFSPGLMWRCVNPKRSC